MRGGFSRQGQLKSAATLPHRSADDAEQELVSLLVTDTDRLLAQTSASCTPGRSSASAADLRRAALLHRSGRTISRRHATRFGLSLLAAFVEVYRPTAHDRLSCRVISAATSSGDMAVVSTIVVASASQLIAWSKSWRLCCRQPAAALSIVSSLILRRCSASSTCIVKPCSRWPRFLRPVASSLQYSFMITVCGTTTCIAKFGAHLGQRGDTQTPPRDPFLEVRDGSMSTHRMPQHGSNLLGVKQHAPNLDWLSPAF